MVALLLSARGRGPLLASSVLALTAALLPAPVVEAAPPEGDAVVTRKAGYVHVLWDAAALAPNGKPPSRGALLGAAARLAASRLKSGDPEQVRIDVVIVREKDGYGKPRWDSLTRLAKLAGRRTSLAKWASSHPAPAPADETLFEKAEWF